MNNKLAIIIIVLYFFSIGLVSAGAEPILEAIKAPAGNSAYLTLHAKGDQIFHCVLKTGAYNWKWHAPDAKLYDKQNALVGSHGAGPSWTHKDASSINAKVIQKIDAPNKTNTPWLLLEVTGHKGGGVLAQARYLQRINTQGGVAPLSGCDANHLGTEKRVPYTADYSFYNK